MSPQEVPWTARALPATIWIQNAPSEAADPSFSFPAARLTMLDLRTAHQFLVDGGQGVHIDPESEPAEWPAALLPLDRLFKVRAQSALRLWRTLARQNAGANPASLSAARRNRLLLALRAPDGRTTKASYREIAAVLFGSRTIPERGLKNHDLRDRTIRLVRSGKLLMRGGYATRVDASTVHLHAGSACIAAIIARICLSAGANNQPVLWCDYACRSRRLSPGFRRMVVVSP